MSTSPAQPDAPDADELVAYLDGELSPDECRRIERRLTNDADYRRRLAELDQAWSALDELPTATVDDDFARTTIEMVAVAAEQEAKRQSHILAASGKRRRLWIVAGGVALAAAAFAATRTFVPNRNRALIDDLPVIAQFDVLSEVGNIDYLRGLAKLDLESASRAAATEPDAPEDSAWQEWDSIDARRRWIESLSPDKKAALAAKLDRFERLPHDEQDRLRNLQREIAAADDRQQLDATLANYAVWLQGRTAGERLTLRDPKFTTPERLEHAKQLDDASAREARRQLSLEDEKALQESVLALVEERRGELLQELRRGRPDSEQRIDRLGHLSSGQVALVIIGRDLFAEQRREQPGQPREQLERRRDQLIARLTAQLSPDAQQYFESLRNPERGRQLYRWTYEALAPKLGPEKLEQYFVQDLTNDEREYLLGLPLPEMEERLQQMFMSSQVGLPNGGPPRRFWREGPASRGPRGRERNQFRDGGPGDRGPRDGRRLGPPGPGGPDGPPPRRPPPRDRGDWPPPPPEDGPHDRPPF